MKVKKRDLISASIFLLTLLTSTPVSSSELTDPGWFITAKLGKASNADSYDELNYGATSWEFSPDYNSAISLGYEIESFSLEAEYSHRRFDAERRICPSCGYYDSGIVVNLGGYQIQDSFLITGTWFPIHDNTMKPFLGAGAGYSLISWKNVRMESNDYGFYGSDSVFTYKLTTGVEFQLMEKMAILLAYDYLKPDNVDVYDVPTGAIGKLNNQQMNIIELGIKYHF